MAAVVDEPVDAARLRVADARVAYGQLAALIGGSSITGVRAWRIQRQNFHKDMLASVLG